MRTVINSREDLDLVKNQDGVSDASFAAALRIRDRLGFRGEGKRGMYLCHTLCELGATPLSSGLDDVHDFLVNHPTDVVVIVNQDYVTPADYVKAVADAGLTPLRLHAAGRRRLADAAPDDRGRPPARDAGREPGRRRALVPAGL